MKKINYKFNLLLILFLLISIIFGITQTYSWISFEKSFQTNLDLGSFKIVISATLDNNKLAHDNGNYNLNGLSQMDSNEITQKIQINDQDYNENKNYIEKFKMNINIKADISGYMRIKILDEWIVTKRFLNFDRNNTESIYTNTDDDLLFNLGDNWVYDKKTKYCYYTKIINKSNNDINILFIESGVPYLPKINSFLVETCDLNLGVSVQVVQANRFQEIWGIDEIPQKKVEEVEGVNNYE